MMKRGLGLVVALIGCGNAPYYVRQTYRTPQADFEVRCGLDYRGAPTNNCRYVNGDTGLDANAIPDDSDDVVAPGALERLNPDRARAAASPDATASEQ
jgi:hypothetical protein